MSQIQPTLSHNVVKLGHILFHVTLTAAHCSFVRNFLNHKLIDPCRFIAHINWFDLKSFAVDFRAKIESLFAVGNF